MRVYIRAMSESSGHLFTECAVDELSEVINELKRANGVYYNGEYISDLSHQFVLDETDGAYAEILINDGG